jgi:hypothetical protein
MVIELTDENYVQTVEETDKAIFIDFYSPFCGPCCSPCFPSSRNTSATMRSSPR